MYCMCGAPDCRSCGPAQGWHVHDASCADEYGYYACGMVAYGDDEPAQNDPEPDDEEDV